MTSLEMICHPYLLIKSVVVSDELCHSSFCPFVSWMRQLAKVEYNMYHLWNFCWTTWLDSWMLHVKIFVKERGILCLFFWLHYWRNSLLCEIKHTEKNKHVITKAYVIFRTCCNYNCNFLIQINLDQLSDVWLFDYPL